MTNLVQFPGLGLSFELDRVAFSIGGADIYWYGVCIAFGLCLALVFAFRRCTEFGIGASAAEVVRASTSRCPAGTASHSAPRVTSPKSSSVMPPASAVTVRSAASCGQLARSPSA